MNETGGRAIGNTDDELVREALRGDQEAYRRLVERHRDAFYRLAWSVLRHSKDAEDAVQEAFVRIYLSLPKYQYRGFVAWASRIAVNIAIDARRSRNRKDKLVQMAGLEEAAASERPRGSPEESGGSGPQAVRTGLYAPAAETVALARERQMRIRSMIDKLPRGFRRVVKSFYLEEKPRRVIAEQERIEPKSVESKLYRAKRWMRSHWKEEDLE